MAKILAGYEDPEKDYDFTYLSLGAGIQSTALLLMSEKGIGGCPKADMAIFADTGDEMSFTYDNVKYLQEKSSIPIHIASAGKLGEEYLEMVAGKRSRSDSIPAFTQDFPGGKVGMLPRQCTYGKKIVPISRLVRKHLGFKKGERMAGKVAVRCLMGISFDEVIRMKPSQVSWADNSYPLCDQRLRRDDCLKLLDEHGWKRPEKSACSFCPYRTSKGWLWLKTQWPEIWDEAVAFDKAIRDQPKMESKVYLHRQCVPLDEVILENGQMEFDFMSGDECSGHCGV